MALLRDAVAGRLEALARAEMALAYEETWAAERPAAGGKRKATGEGASARRRAQTRTEQPAPGDQERRPPRNARTRKEQTPARVKASERQRRKRQIADVCADLR